ncbi:MAG: hypothetical protein BRC25_00640 [Parcubacteria group bacterium SW_6_46_9]|nr:MAG: hypothetical protein BRC25_00640 [Parcubacteria group bacterium SW_6_46_9]
MIDRQTFQKYQKDPIGFAKRKEKEAKEAGFTDVEKLWEKHRTKLEQLEDQHERKDNGRAEAEEVIAYSEATRMLDTLQEGPSGWRRLIWKAEDAGAYISSFVSWIGSLFAGVLDWLKDNSATVTGVIAYSAVILAVVWMFTYVFEHKLTFQFVLGAVIAAFGLMIMTASEKTGRNITAGVLVGLIALFTLVFSVAPGPEDALPHYAGVVTNRNTHEVTRILETPAAFSAFGFNETVAWYKIGDEDTPVSKNFEDVNGLDITVVYHLTPKVKKGDTVNTEKLGSPSITRKRVSQVVENSPETDNAVGALGLQKQAKHLRRELEVSNELFAVAVESVEISATVASETKED